MVEALKVTKQNRRTKKRTGYIVQQKARFVELEANRNRAVERKALGSK